MSDDFDPAAEALDEQGSSQTDSPAPWGEDFDPARAWRTITHQRDLLKEFESDAKTYRKLREDEDARKQFVSEFYEFEDEDADDYADDDDYGDTTADTQPNPQLDQLQETVMRLMATQANRDFEEDLAKAEAEASIKLTARERKYVKNESLANGFGPDSTRAAIKEILEDREALRTEHLESYRGSKKAPHVSSAGKSASQKINLDNPLERANLIDEMMDGLM